MLSGSCFAEHIHHKLLRYKYKVYGNPFGILFNPASIARSFERIAKKEYFHADELVQADGLYHSMDHHGSFSAPDKEAVLTNINNQIDQAAEHLSKSRFLFVSLGTTRVYRYKSTGLVAGNCHKIPQVHFEEESLSVDQCINELSRIYQHVKAISPTASLIWTVSPVRYLKEGLISNQRSKSTLIVAIDQFLKEHTDTSYFEAYEIMIDQLRDYRYYAKDLVHPSEVAIDIIWEHFTQTYIDPQEHTHHPSIEKVRRAMEHRFLHENTKSEKVFAEAQLKIIHQLEAIFPEMNWKEERQYFFHLIEPD